MMRRLLRKLPGPVLMRRLPFWLIAIAVLVLAGLVLMGTVLSIDLTVALNGQTRPLNWTEIRTEREGVIAHVHVTEGEWVESGVLTAELFNDDEVEAVIMAERRLARFEADRERVAAELRLTAARQATGVLEASAFLDEMGAERREVEAGVHPEQIRAAKEGLAEARLRLDEAEKEFRRGRILIDSGAITPNEWERREMEVEMSRIGLERADANLSGLQTRFREHDHDRGAARLGSARARLASARAGEHAIALKEAELVGMDEMVEEARASLAIARLNLKRTQLVAPTAGRILTGDLDQLIGRGVFPGGLVMAVGDPETVVIRARLPEGKAADVMPGQRVKVFIAAFPHTRFRVFEGEVISVSPYFQTIDWEALGIPEQEVTPEMREAFSIATVLLDDPLVRDAAGAARIIAPGLSARCDVLLDSGTMLGVALRYLRRGYKNIPNFNFHF